MNPLNTEKRNKLSGILTPRQAFIILLIFQCLVLAFVLLFCSIKYEVSDDFIVELLLSGGFSGELDWHLLFSNPFLGFILYPLYLINRSISWYFVCQLGICFMSYLALSWVAAHKENKILGIAVTVILTMFSAGDLYIIPQFTKTAAVVIISGAILFLDAVFNEEKVIPAVCGALLTILGTFIRFNVLYEVGLFICIPAIYLTVRGLIRNDHKIKWLLTRIIPSLVLVALVFGLDKAGSAVFRADPDYEFYREYNSLRGAIVDYPYEDYSAFANEMAEIGISENDYLMLNSWNLGDYEKYDLETLRQISAILNRHHVESEVTAQNVFDQIGERGILLYPIVWCIWLLTIFCGFANWRRIWIPILSMLMCIFYIGLFYNLGRTVYRVEFGFMFAAAATIIWATDRAKESAIEYVRLGVCILLSCAAIIFWGINWFPKKLNQPDGAPYRENIYNYLYESWNYAPEKYSLDMQPGKAYEEFTRLARENPDNIYMLEFLTTIQTYYYNFSPKRSAATVFPDNICWIAGVTSGHPAEMKWLSEHGYNSTLRALLDDNVFYVGNGCSEYALTYLHENGYPNATVEFIGEVDQYQIYKFHAE